MPDSHVSRGHVCVDLGEDEFTQGRLHPMIDPSLRNRRILQEARDPATAVILLDIVLGYGAHPDPAGATVEAIREAQHLAAAAGRHLVFVASVCGTEGDPTAAQPAGGEAARGRCARAAGQRLCGAAGGVDHAGVTRVKTSQRLGEHQLRNRGRSMTSTRFRGAKQTSQGKHLLLCLLILALAGCVAPAPLAPVPPTPLTAQIPTPELLSAHRKSTTHPHSGADRHDSSRTTDADRRSASHDTNVGAACDRR